MWTLFFVLLGQLGMALTLVQGPRQFNATFIKSSPTSISGRSVTIYGRAVQISGRSEKKIIISGVSAVINLIAAWGLEPRSMLCLRRTFPEKK